MPDPYPLPDAIPQLVERFAEHVDAYRSGSYNETQVRREFIDPFPSSDAPPPNRAGSASARPKKTCRVRGAKRNAPSPTHR